MDDFERKKNYWEKLVFNGALISGIVLDFCFKGAAIYDI